MCSSILNQSHNAKKIKKINEKSFVFAIVFDSYGNCHLKSRNLHRKLLSKITISAKFANKNRNKYSDVINGCPCHMAKKGFILCEYKISACVSEVIFVGTKRNE